MIIPKVLTNEYICVDLLKRGVLTLVALQTSSLQVPPEYEQDPMCQKFNATDIRRTYCGMVKALDEGVGKIIATLKELNVLDDFFLIFTSDNGAAGNAGASAWPLRGHKQTVYEVCKMWVLKGTHVQCMRFVTFVIGGTQCMRCVKPGC